MAYGQIIKRVNNNVRSKASNSVADNSEGRHDSKVSRISAQQCYEKYIAMASESVAMGNRVAAESFYQHAEHYLRLMNEFEAVVQPPLLHGISDLEVSNTFNHL